MFDSVTMMTQFDPDLRCISEDILGVFNRSSEATSRVATAHAHEFVQPHSRPCSDARKNSVADAD